MKCLLLMAGGSGTRFGADIPKQYIEVNGEPLLAYTLRRYSEGKNVDRVIIVSNPEWIDYTMNIGKKIFGTKLFDVVAGGYTRSHSVKNGLDCCRKFMGQDDLILIHDATNPFVDNRAINLALGLAEEYGIAVVGTKQLHTPYFREDEKIKSVIPRDSMCSGYSPEIFRFSVITSFFDGVSDEKLENMTSTVALALDQGLNVKFVAADLCNVKITYPYDLETFIAIINHNSSIKEKRENNMRENIDFKSDIQDYILKEIKILQSLDVDAINEVMNVLEYARMDGRQIFICGNGGSAATASHYCCDFNKGVSDKLEKKYNFECLSDNIPTMTAVANDIGYDEVFRYPLKAKMRGGQSLSAFLAVGIPKM